jgi:DNA-binding response OmpR family regulator
MKERATMQLHAARKLTVLAVIPGAEDQESLRVILARSTWELRLVSTFQQAQRALDDPAIGVIIADPDLPDGHSWQHIASAAAQLAPPPSVIVASRLGDDRLWAEVLNLGGCDLLLKPFDAKEVLHSVGMAWRCWRDKAALAGAARREGMLRSA